MQGNVQIICPKCDSRLPISEKLMNSGSKIKCGGCGAVLNPLEESRREAGEGAGIGSLHEFDEGMQAVGRSAAMSPGAMASRGFGAAPRAYFLPVALVLLVLLSGQLFWVNKDSWSQRPALQPLYEFICVRAPRFCNLSNLVETNVEIHGLIRTPGEVPGSVLISGSLINHSSEPVDFPQIFVRFTDLDGRVVASGVFDRNSYLHQPVNSPTMFSQQPYKFQLSISSSGREALSSSFNFEAELLRQL